MLRPEERDCLVALTEGRRIDINREQELARLGLLDADGRIFSDVFAATIGRFRAEVRAPRARPAQRPPARLPGPQTP